MPHWDLDAPAKLEFDDVSALTVAADVRLAGEGGINIGSISGSVTLRLPADSDARVRMRSTAGPVRSEFGSLRAAMSPASHSVSGNLGAGFGNMAVTTVSGAVTLLRRPPHAAPHAEAEMESETR